METEVKATVFMEIETGETDAGRAPLSAEFGYAAADPFAVTMTFYCEGDEVTRWRLDRDLLAEGCERPAGAGDVRVAPTSDPVRGDGVRIELLGTPGPAGRAQAVLHAAAADLTAFLAVAHEIVRPGEEQVSLDELDELLDGVDQDESTYGEHAA
ncbi:hypothetical protein GCM10010252_41130 [Streptomyces aureoverticillatus]|nr:hypothetical protein GCM10010252_41130 [Streptomyces aureoverticillatus]